MAGLGHPSKFQLVSRLGFITAATSFTGGQPNFARCLAVSLTGALYMHFRGLLPPDGILPGANFTLRPTLAFYYIGSIAAQHSTSGHQPNFATLYIRNGITELTQTAPPIFGWAAIKLGICPLSSFILFHCLTCICAL